MSQNTVLRSMNLGDLKNTDTQYYNEISTIVHEITSKLSALSKAYCDFF